MCSRQRHHRVIRERTVQLKVLFVLLLISMHVLATEAPSEGRHRLEKFLTGLITLSAKFEQRVYDEAGVLLETATGDLNLARPGKFSWVYFSPYHQTITSDGHTLWLYDEELAQVTVNAVDANAAGSAAQLLGAEMDLDTQYKITETGQRAQGQWIKLIPKIAGQQYTEVEIGLSPETLSAMRLTDNLGQVTELRFSDLQRNPTLDGQQFAFKIPPGVDVVTGTSSKPD